MSSIVRRSASRICLVLSTRIGRSSVLLVLDCGQSRTGVGGAALTARHLRRRLESGERSLAQRVGHRSTMRGAVYVNGTISPADQAVDSRLRSRLRVRRRRLRDAAHLQPRAVPLRSPHARGCARPPQRIHLDVPFDDDDAASWVDRRRRGRRRARGEAYIRILLTRGVGDLTYDSDATPAPSLVIIVKPLESRRRASATTASRSRWCRSCATIRDRSTRSSSRTTCSTTPSRCRRRTAAAPRRR